MLGEGEAVASRGVPKGCRIGWVRGLVWLPWATNRWQGWCIRVFAVMQECNNGSVRLLSLESRIVTIAKAAHYISK